MKKRPTAQDKVVTGATINDSPDVNYAVYQTLRIFPDAAHAQAFVAQRLIEAKRCQAIRVVTDDDETSGIKVSIAPITLSAPDTKAWSLTASQGVVRVNSLRTVGNVVIALDVLSNDPDVNAKASTLQPLWVAIDSRVAAS